METLLTLRELYRNVNAYAGKNVKIGGWVRNRRASKSFGFIMLSDGTYFQPVQVVITDALDNFAEMAKINIGAALIVNGAMLYISDKLLAGRKSLPAAGADQALAVGFAQAFAALPGISRSGSTVTAGVLAGLRRPDAVDFSFLLSFPAVLGACLVKLAEALRSGFDKALLLPALAGFAAAALSGLLAIRLVRTLAQRGNFRNFAWSCWTAGLGAIIASILT